MACPTRPMPRCWGGPRGDLGYLAYAIFYGDNRTFAVIIMAPPWDRDFRALRHPQEHLRAARLLPGVAAWIDADAARPVTPVMPFGQVTNTVRDYLTAAGPVAPGLQPIGDALCHTNPSFAFGASMALHQAFTLADLLAVAADHHDLARRFDAAVGEDLRDRHRAVAAEDRDRARWWGGEPIDVTDPAASMALFLRAVVGGAGGQHPATNRQQPTRNHTAKLDGTITASPLVKRRPCLRSHGRGHGLKHP